MKTRELESFWQSTFVDGQFRESLENEKQKKENPFQSVLRSYITLFASMKKETSAKKVRRLILGNKKKTVWNVKKNHINVFNL